MKIAIVAPSPVPFVIGGAENLWTGWLAALNAEPGVEADLIKLPTPERDFWQIADSYRRFAELDLGHFDRVISTKYPAWMVAHPDHHVFLQHKLRGLYDTWPAGLATTLGSGGDAPAVARLVEVLARARGARSALGEIFGALAALRAAEAELPPALFALPGALIRLLVHALDEIGLARGAIRRYAAISATVAGRADYFPAVVDVATEVEVIHHPTLPRPAAGVCAMVPVGAIFTASRLDGPKRMDWVIKAYKAAGIRTPLVIAGDGPQRAALASLAANAGDVRLVGRLSDAELVAAYAAASFVPFVPDREDYGLITLEALQAGKPVLTVSDAGGVTELVRDGVNGLVCAPTVAALAEGMRRLDADAGLRAGMSARAVASVAHIRWPLLAQAFCAPRACVVVVNTFAIYPPCNGGQVRMLSLYRELARCVDVRVVNLSHKGAQALTRWLAPGLKETVVPMSEAHAAFEAQLTERLQASCADIAAMLRPELTPAWTAAIAEACARADVVVACHPYGWPALRSVWAGPVVYESLNVEVDLKSAIFGHADEVLAAVGEVEGACAREAPLVLCCSDEDAARMALRYGLARNPEVVANGVDGASYTLLTAQARSDARSRLGLGEARLALFVGSLHGPNVDAAMALLSIARACPDVRFAVVGSVCEAAALAQADVRAEVPDNVWLVGRVSDAALRVWLAVADVGVNPMTSGSGTNLKLLEYAAAGLPILSTPFGGRGGILVSDEHFEVAELNGFGAALAALLAPDAVDLRHRRAQAARVRALQAGDWRTLAARMLRLLRACEVDGGESACGETCDATPSTPPGPVLARRWGC